MDTKLAEEGGVQAIGKIIKDGRNGRILLLSSLVEKQLLSDKKRLMVAKFIRVAKRFLSGAINPADARWCNAQLDANLLTPSEGIGPGGCVRLPTQADATKQVLTVAMSRPGLPLRYSKHDVNEAFRLVWIAIALCGLFAASVSRWVLGLGLGHFYSILLALSFGTKPTTSLVALCRQKAKAAAQAGTGREGKRLFVFSFGCRSYFLLQTWCRLHFGREAEQQEFPIFLGLARIILMHHMTSRVVN